MQALAVILSGGKSSRFGSVDKAAATLNGERLVDHVIDRLKKQADQIAFAGPDQYGHSFPAIADRTDGPGGPVGGIWSIYNWLCEQDWGIEGFFTVPVDAPFFPSDLLAKLKIVGGSSVAEVDGRANPSFAYWRMVDLQRAFNGKNWQTSPALMWLADETQAQQVSFESQGGFTNINTPDDLERLNLSVR